MAPNVLTIAKTSYLMKSTGKCILGKNTSELLNSLKVCLATKGEVIQTITTSTKLNPSTQQLTNKYEDI